MRLTKIGHRVVTASLAIGLFAVIGITQTLDAEPIAPPPATTSPVTTCGSDADCAAADAAARGITEDDPEWNCLTMGNHVCGPGYVPLPADKYLDIFMPESDVIRDPSTYCLWDIDATTTVVCSDGTIALS